MINFKQKLSLIPHKPGVYKYFDASGKIIYIGKAIDLRKRVASYFNKNNIGKTAILVKKIADINYIVVNTETDALLLENTLIKKYKPRYNVLLKDDKTYPWICVINERFPRIVTTRNVTHDGSKYFGPYTSGKMMHTLLNLIRQLYPIRTCNYKLTEENIADGKFSVCLEYHISNCLGPCVGAQEETDYNFNIELIKDILKGNSKQVIKLLREHMQIVSKNLEFEKAQLLKEKIKILSSYQAKSTVVNPSIDNIAVFSIVSDINSGMINFMRVNNGVIIQVLNMELKKRLDETDEELLQLAIIEIQLRMEVPVKEYIIPFKLSHKQEGIVYTIPQRGDKKKLLELSERNAKFYRLEKHKQLKLINPEKHVKRILDTMERDLRLKEKPVHIECFDNSNIQGTNPVAACVVFKNCKPSKKEYRHFKINTVTGPDDYASMEEVIYRRYSRQLKEKQPLPQLIVIDGGKGQLHAAVNSLKKLKIYGKLAIVGIAKRLEELYFPNDPVPLYIDKKSETLKVIQHIRDEAHRFGITHHRKLRSKAAITSELTQIKSIGEQTNALLLREFKSVKMLQQANETRIAEVVGKKKAKLIYTYFHPK